MVEIVIVAQEIPVAVKEGDRRVLLVDVGTDVGLITCVWSRIGHAARHSFHSNEQSGRGFVWSSPMRLSTLKVVTENKLEMKRQEGNE